MEELRQKTKNNFQNKSFERNIYSITLVFVYKFFKLKSRKAISLLLIKYYNNNISIVSCNIFEK